MAAQDIKDAGGFCDDSAIINKIIRGLSTQYTTFVDQYHFFRDLSDAAGTPTATFSLQDVVTRLLTFESDNVRSLRPFLSRDTE